MSDKRPDNIGAEPTPTDEAIDRAATALIGRLTPIAQIEEARVRAAQREARHRHAWADPTRLDTWHGADRLRGSAAR